MGIWWRWCTYGNIRTDRGLVAIKLKWKQYTDTHEDQISYQEVRFPLPTTCAVIRLVHLARVSPVLLKMLIPSNQMDSSALLEEVTNSDLNGGHSLQFVSILSAFHITYNPASRQKTMKKTPSNPSTTLSLDEPPSWHEKLCLSPVLSHQLNQERKDWFIFIDTTDFNEAEILSHRPEAKSDSFLVWSVCNRIRSWDILLQTIILKQVLGIPKGCKTVPLRFSKLKYK